MQKNWMKVVIPRQSSFLDYFWIINRIWSASEDLADGNGKDFKALSWVHLSVGSKKEEIIPEIVKENTEHVFRKLKGRDFG